MKRPHRKRYHGSGMASQRWQHLEFFQWFSRNFDAVRSKDFTANPTVTPKDEITLKVTPHGIGIGYCKSKGAVIVHLSSPNGKSKWKELHRPGKNYGEFDHASTRLRLEDRFTFWRSFLPELTDLRQVAMLTAILAYRINPIHPNCRQPLAPQTVFPDHC